MLEFEFSSKNVEKAIEEGLNKLKLEKDNVDIKILETGGFFKKAKIKLIIPKEICDKSEEVKKLLTLSKIEKKVINNELKEKDKFEKKNEDNFQQKDKKDFQKDNTKSDASVKLGVNIKPKLDKDIKLDTDVDIKTENANIDYKKSEQFDECEKFLQGLLNISKIDAYVNGSENETEINFEIKGKNLARLVGIKGQGLNAIQYLLKTISSKYFGNSKRVYFDIDGYKNKRKLSLENFANKMALKVIETNEKICLRPMTAYERRIVHTIIQGYPNLISASTGVEPYRVLTIDIKK